MNKIYFTGKDSIILLQLNNSKGAYLLMNLKDHDWMIVKDEMLDALDLVLEETEIVYQYETMVKTLYDLRTGYIKNRIEDGIQAGK